MIKVTVEDVFAILFACFVRQARRVHKGCQSNQLENSRKFSFFSDTTTCSSLGCFMPHIREGFKNKMEILNGICLKTI